MRAILILLIVVTTAASVTLGVWYIKRSGKGDVDPPISIATIPDRIAVLAGANEEVEVLLRPYLPEEGQDSFNRERLDEMLGLRNPGLDYLRLWLVNRSDKVLPVDSSMLAGFRWPGHDGWQARSLARLLAEAREARQLRPAELFMLSSLAREDLKTLEARAFVELVVAVPRDPDWRKIEKLALSAFGGLELEPAQVRASALDEFMTRPQGELLDRLIFPAESQDLQASRK